MTTALICDDEPLMLKRLRNTLADVWPELLIVAEARNGVEALSLAASHRPDIVFLDIQMPGKNGLEVAAEIGDSAHIVFVTAYDEYAVGAFERGALDYVLKPAEAGRLAETVTRLKKRMQQPPKDVSELLAELLNQRSSNTKLKWLRASLGNVTRLINIDDVLFFQSDTKYTRIVMPQSEALVRTPLKELLVGLDEEAFWQIHRGTVVNASAIERVVREGPEILVVHLRSHAEKLRVSRQYFHLFKQ